MLFLLYANGLDHPYELQVVNAVLNLRATNYRIIIENNNV